MSTRPSVSLALLRHRPLNLHSLNAPRSNHASVYWALRDVVLANSCQNRQYMSSSLYHSLALDSYQLRIKTTYLRIDSQCSGVRVVDGIALLVITRILLNARSSMQSTHGLANVHERLVVAAAGEAGGGDIHAVLGHVLYEQLLDVR